jgi:protein phosphatase
VSWPYALVSDTGRMRENNEDCARVLPELGLYVIADGMGGHVAGEVASRVAADTMAAEVARHPNPRRVRDQQGILHTAIVAANTAVLREGETRKLLGMGTTLTALRVTRRTATISHIGDTRAYFVRPKRLQQLTTDHTLVAMLVATGVVHTDEAQNHPDKHLLTQAIGTHAEIEPDVFQKRIPRGCRILLCTDGLHDHTPLDEVHRLALLPDIDEAAQALVDAANSCGGPDNVTVILIASPE